MHLETEYLGLEMLAEIGVALADELVLGIAHQFPGLVVERLVRVPVPCRHANGDGLVLPVPTMEGLKE